MRKTIKQTIRGYMIPSYIIDILTEGLCPGFLEMTVIHENDAYVIAYEATNYEKLDIKKLDFYGRIDLLNEILKTVEDNEDHFVMATNYLIEPELIYCKTGRRQGGIKLVFYPDRNHISLEKKLQSFAYKLCEGLSADQVSTFERIIAELTRGDMARVYRIIDKTIDHYREAA